MSIMGYAPGGFHEATVDLNQSESPCSSTSLLPRIPITFRTLRPRNGSQSRHLSPLGKISLISAIEILMSKMPTMLPPNRWGAQCYKLKGSIAAADIASMWPQMQKRPHCLL